MQVAEETRDMAGNTLDALHEQGQRLDRVEGDLYEVGLTGTLPSCPRCPCGKHGLEWAAANQKL